MKTIVLFIFALLLLFPVSAMPGNATIDGPINSVKTGVLPLVNSTRDPSLSWIGHGLQDAMIVDLAYLKNVEIMILPFDAAPLEKVIAYAKENQFQHIWTGEYRGNAGSMVVDVSVIDVSSGKTVTTRRFTSTEENLLRDASTAVLGVAHDLSMTVGKSEKKRIVSRKTSSREAGKLNAEWRMRFNRVAENEENMGKDEQNEIITQMREILMRALAKDPQYAEAWANLGFVYGANGQGDQAQEALQKALEIKPYLVSANHLMGVVLLLQKKGKAALAYFRKEMEINPSMSIHGGHFFQLLLSNGEKADAKAWASRLFRSSSPSARIRAIAVFAEIGDKTTIPVLMGALKDPDRFVRGNAVAALAYFGDAPSVPASALIELLEDPDKDIRITAMEALRERKEGSAVPRLVAALQDREKEVRWIAASALGVIGDPSALPALREALNDHDKKVRIAAAWALGKMADASAVPLLKDLLKDADREVREYAAMVLGETGGPAAVPALIDALKDKNAMVQITAAVALGKIGDKTAASALVEAVKTLEDFRVADALAKIQDESIVPALVDALQDPDKKVRENAANALGVMQDKRAVPALIAALSDTEIWVRARAVLALEKLAERSAVPALIPLLHDADPNVRGYAAGALGKLGDSSVVPLLTDALKDPSQWVRLSAAEALGKVGDKTAIAALIAALKDRDEHVQRKAAEALGKLGNKTGIPVLVEALHDTESWWRMEAAKALGALGEAEGLYEDFHKTSDIFIFNRIRTNLLFPARFDLLTNARDPFLKASGYYLLALKAREEGRHRDQLAYSSKTLTHINPKNETALSILALWLKAQAEVKLNTSKDAIRTMDEADQLLAYLSKKERKEHEDLFDEYTLFLKGEVLAAAGAGKKAQQALEEALGLLARQKDYFKRDQARKLEAMVRTSFGALQISMGKANLQQAVETGRDYQANDSVEMENEEKRYLELARQKIAEGDYEAAQKLVEELNLRRANYVNRRMKLTLADAAKQQSIDEYRRKEQEIEDLGRKIDTLARSKAGEESQAGPRGSDDQVRQLESERIDKRRQLQVYLTGLKKTHPDIAALLGAKPLELAAIQEQLPEDTAILQYLMLPDKLVVFVIKKGGIDIVETPAKKADLKGKVESLRKAIFSRSKSKDSRKIQPLARELHATLIKPIEETQKLKGITVLGIAPNGFLHQLPFGVMMNSNNQYLIDQYTLFFMNSTSMLGVALEREKHKSKGAAGLLAVSNPDGTLPAADSEVADIAKLFDKKQVYSQKQAKKDIIEKKQKDYSILHLSTHGVFNPVDSTKSYLVMADGKLTLEDIWGLPLSGTSLTVLSACETGIGDILSGDDVVSLENAFIYAGSPTVIATLWKVADQSTAELMTLFYRNLIKGKTKAEALTEAQRELRKTYDHPFFWAAVTLRGEWR